MTPDVLDWLCRYARYDFMSPLRGLKFDRKNAPWLAEVFACYGDPTIRRLVFMCSAQSLKTETMLLGMLYRLGTRPDGTMWVDASKEAVIETAARAKDMMRRCSAVRPLMGGGRYDETKDYCEIAGAPVFFNGGGGSGNQVSRKPLGDIYIDEMKDQKPDLAAKALERLGSRWDGFGALFSTPKEMGKDIHPWYLEGDQRVWHLNCPSCGVAHPVRWRHADGQYNMTWDKDAAGEEKIASIRYNCPEGCGYQWADTPTDRDYIIQEGFWKPLNPGAPKSNRSYHWGKIIVPWRRWYELVEKWETSNRALKRGNVAPLRVFIQESLGEPFEERVEPEEVELKLSDYHLADFCRATPKDILPAIKGEQVRILTIDRQEGSKNATDEKLRLPHRWAVVRAWRVDGSSQQLWAGYVSTSEGCRAIQQLYGIEDIHTYQDARWDTVGVQQDCTSYGWRGCAGEDNPKGFVGEEFINGRKYQVTRWFSNFQRWSGGATYIRLCTEKVRDIAAVFFRGGAAPFEFPGDTPMVFREHMGGQVKRETLNKKTGETELRWVKIAADHLRDCENMQVGIALAYGLIQGWDQMVDITSTEKRGLTNSA